jgi:hypothetical protein
LAIERQRRLWIAGCGLNGKGHWRLGADLAPPDASGLPVGSLSLSSLLSLSALLFFGVL